MSEKRYTRIGLIAKCDDCEKELHGYWTAFKHHFFHHTWEGKKIRKGIERWKN